MDLEGIRLLENMLAVFRGAHAAGFHTTGSCLTVCATMIVEIRDAKLLVYQGNYSSYLRQREAVFERQLFEHQQYVQEKKRLRRDAGRAGGKVKKDQKGAQKDGQL